MRHAARLLDAAVLLDHLVGLLDGGRLALDVGEHGVDLGRLAQDLGFHRADKVVRLEQRHVLVQFDVLLDAQAPVVRLHAEFVDADVVARGHGADAVEDAFGAALARNGVDDDIGLGQGAVHGVGGRAAPVRRCARRCSAAAGPASDRQSTRRRRAARAPARRPARRGPARTSFTIWRRVSAGILSISTPTVSRARRESEAQNHERNHDGGQRIGIAQPGNAES